jgi:hypothetical protein
MMSWKLFGLSAATGAGLAAFEAAGGAAARGMAIS